jgi:hypothetical protein
MRPRFKPCLDILPKAQRAMWDALAPSSDLDFVLYGGTAIALRLGHRTSLDFDFFRAEPLDKDQLRDRFSFMRSAKIVQDALNTLVPGRHRSPSPETFPLAALMLLHSLRTEFSSSPPRRTFSQQS